MQDVYGPRRRTLFHRYSAPTHTVSAAVDVPAMKRRKIRIPVCSPFYTIVDVSNSSMPRVKLSPEYGNNNGSVIMGRGGRMARSTTKSSTKSTKRARQGGRDGHPVRETSSDAVVARHATEAGVDFLWHYGRVTRMGSFSGVGGREVVIVWEEGGVSSEVGSISDEEWEIFTLAFMTTGRVAILSDGPGEDWMSDFRFLEAVR